MMRLAAALVFLAACGARTEIAGVVAATDASTDVTAQTAALVFNSCAPNDAPEVVYAFGATGTCDDIPNFSNSDRITFESSAPTKVGSYGGTAFVCEGQSCSEATGTLTITAISDASVSGSYHLVSKTLGTVHDGTFTAVVCHNPALCG